MQIEKINAANLETSKAMLTTLNSEILSLYWPYYNVYACYRYLHYIITDLNVLIYSYIPWYNTDGEDGLRGAQAPASVPADQNALQDNQRHDRIDGM